MCTFKIRYIQYNTYNITFLKVDVFFKYKSQAIQLFYMYKIYIQQVTLRSRVDKNF